jgi:hypothetical protein
LNKEIVKKYSNDYKPLVALTLSLGLLLIYTTMAIQPTQNLYMQMQRIRTLHNKPNLEQIKQEKKCKLGLPTLHNKPNREQAKLAKLHNLS